MSYEEKRKLITDLFNAMSTDLCIMAEWGDDDEALLNELETCGTKILMSYAEIFLD